MSWCVHVLMCLRVGVSICWQTHEFIGLQVDAFSNLQANELATSCVSLRTHVFKVISLPTYSRAYKPLTQKGLFKSRACQQVVGNIPAWGILKCRHKHLSSALVRRWFRFKGCNKPNRPVVTSFPMRFVSTTTHVGCRLVSPQTHEQISVLHQFAACPPSFLASHPSTEKRPGPAKNSRTNTTR